MKIKNIRTIIAAVAFVVLAAGLIGGVTLGTFSSIGPDVWAVICPLGALETMIASKTFIPRAAISVVFFAIFFFLVGRAFCAWLCPVGVLKTLRKYFRSPKVRKAEDAEKRRAVTEIAKFDLTCGHACGACAAACSHAGGARGADAEKGASAALKKLEGSDPAAPAPDPAALAAQAGIDPAAAAASKAGLTAKGKRPAFDSRFGVLLGALLSSAVFGFPVFCLVCPVGLCFATALLVWHLFAFGDTTIAIILIIALLVIELVFLRKWCSHFCPLSALMNLAGRASVTLKPTIDESKCLESVKGTPCSRCAQVCEHEINLRHLDAGLRDLADCTRCGDCKEVCPAGAISIPLLPRSKGRGDGGASERVVTIVDNGLGGVSAQKEA